MGIAVYGKQGCPFCSLLKSELDRRDFTYRYFDMTDDSLRQDFYAATGTKTVPQLFVDNGESSLTQPSGLRIGGWSDVDADWQALEKAR